ncbi:efflux transporter outer membrane subunit [Paraburkholderia bonniea]|uniref:efflux transporter outer membrane subunit n=1 Tax=Paraburkholderia bonniea TaxID=2152891 RepID=UPI001FE5013F|nr:efflux transporter outer membrane subunit [Paraburkholderia bonniea]WJF89103.1 efflux transporter outer membrane subunit [Paraburkholderia bonniea]WJF92419.1 efflux transporter outer membrane subunit [Paraburkholderia bonniea]
MMRSSFSAQTVRLHPLHQTSTLTLRRISTALTLATTLAACSFGPDGKPPVLPQPAHYGIDAQAQHTVSAQGVAQHFAVGAAPVPQWWRQYQSPELDALVAEGLRNSPTLAATDHALAAAREQLRAQVGSSLLPSIDMGAQATRERALAIPVIGPNTFLYDVFAGQIQARYSFDLFGASRLQNAALAARVDMQAYQFEAAQRALAANIVTAALSAAILQAQIEQTQQLVTLAAAQERDTARRYALGAVSHADALSAEQSAATLSASLPGLRVQWLRTRHALAVLLGRTPDAAPADLNLAQLRVPPEVPVIVPSALLQNRPDIQAAELALKAAAADVGVATAQMLPNVSLSASMGQGGFNWPALMSGAGALWSIGASLSQPLFHGGALLAQRRAALASYDAASAQYRQTVLTAFQNVADTLAALEHDAVALAAAAQAAQAARGIFDATRARYQLGAVPFSAVRASEQQWRNARLDEIRYSGARLTDTAALFQAMGQTPPVASTPSPAAPALAETAEMRAGAEPVADGNGGNGGLDNSR